MSQIVDPHTGLADGIPAVNVSVAEIYAPVQNELKEVECILQRELAGDTPWVDELLQHSRIVGGKRMRPVFLLLSGACCGPLDDRHLQMAAALEMIHTATLIHDDVLDNAKTRRHVATANSRWDNKISVLLGDYLFTHSFHVASLTGSAEAMRMLAASSNRVCAGEMHQNAQIGNFDLTQQQYLDIIAGKTAELCAGGCAMGALLSGADAETMQGFETYGRDLGIAFQIIDDVLDLVGSPDEVGKTLGTDVVNRKPTLPVIHALASLKGDARTNLLQQLSADEPPFDVILKTLQESGSIEYARQVARDHANRATTFASSLKESRYTTALKAVASFVLARSY